MKVCSFCKIAKSYELFNKHRRYKDGYSYYCKDCCKLMRKRLKNPEQHKIKNKKRCKIWREQNQIRNKILIKQSSVTRHGISYENYIFLLISQNHCCAICKTPEYNLKKRLYVDHCHETGKVRGLLCQSCNSAIGFAKDSISILENSIDYLLGVKHV